MRKVLFFLSFFQIFFLQAQEYVHQVLILNEGYYDYTAQQIVEPVTVGTYNPDTELYTEVITIDSARFASDIIIDDNFFYVAADNKILKYDLDTYTLLAQQIVQGARHLVINNDKLFVSRGDYDPNTFGPVLFNSYLQVYDKQTLSFIQEFDTLSGPKWSTQNMVIGGDSLYIAINNAFAFGNEQGMIGVLDLNNMSYVNEIDLGTDGKNPDNMMIDGGKIYTVNNKDWSGMSISEHDVSASTTITTNMALVSTGCGTSCLRGGKVTYQISGDTDLYEWDGTVSNVVGVSNNFYDLAIDKVNNYLYASSTDFFSYGEIHIYDQDNILLGTFPCGISPGSIVFDKRMVAGIEDIALYENDSNQLYDLLGRSVTSSKALQEGMIYIKNNKKFLFVR